MYPFRCAVKIPGQLLKKGFSNTVRFLTAVPKQPQLACSVPSSAIHSPIENSNAVTRRGFVLQYYRTLDVKPCSFVSIRRKLSTRAASGSDSPDSGMGPGPGPGPRRLPPYCRSRGEPDPKRPEPSDGSSSKCLEKGYGKPLKPPSRGFLNFCKRLVRIKEKPSNCPPCPTPKPEEISFWDYLFKFDERSYPDPATCRVALRNREACRKTDPRLSDPRYRRTHGDVLIFTGYPRPTRCCTSNEPQPRPPPDYAPPKAVECRRLAETASSFSYPVSSSQVKDRVKFEKRCSGPRPFRVPFEECRPGRRPREYFSCEKGARGVDIAPPMATDRGTCGGRSVGEILAETTISQVNSSAEVGRGDGCESSVAFRGSSRFKKK